jgi:putative membrane protein
MAQIFTESERDQLDRLIKEAEGRIKAQIVLAVVKRSDNYAEIPWKAFAVSTSIAGLLVLLFNLMVPGWISNFLVLVSIGTPLVAGALFFLLTVLIPGFARLFLSRSQAETETRQYAESLFCNRELFDTEERTGLLLLVSRFERQVVILPDKGLSDQLSVEAMQRIIGRMSGYLRQKQLKPAMEAGLEELIKVFENSASARKVKDELPNQIIEEEGV